MKIDRELLRKAWPEGFLATKGVGTVGGWLFDGHRWLKISANTEGAYLRHTQPMPGEVRSGDLLPRVDPSDIATWACLKADLASASLSGMNVSLDPSTGLTWDNMGINPLREGVYKWVLRDGTRNPAQHFYLPTEDQGLALVLGRIQLRAFGQEHHNAR